MRLLFLADIRFPLERANGVQTMETCAAMARRGHKIDLGVRPDTKSPHRDPFAYYGFPPLSGLKIRRSPALGTMWLRRVQYLVQVLVWISEFRKSGVVFTRDLGVASLILQFPRKLRPLLIYESHCFSPTEAAQRSQALSTAQVVSSRKQRRLMRREGRVWRSADGYIVTTTGNLAELEGRFGKRLRVAVIPNGTRLQPDRKYEALQPIPPLSVVYAGHLYPWKGVDVLLQALVNLEGVNATIIGGDAAEPDFQRLQDTSRSIGLGSRVDFVGMVEPSRVSGLLAKGDVLVLPNVGAASAVNYTSPLKLFEYMAAGKPIVASNLPSIREVLRDGENAVLVEPGNPTALTSGLRRVLEDPKLAERIASRAFDEVTEYSWDCRAERVEALLNEVMSGVQLDDTQRASQM